MCVILDKKLGEEIPFSVLEVAAKRNSDGYGVVVADRGQLVTFQGLCESSAKSAEEVSKVLEQAKALPTMVHFRYATAGKRSLANTHPFPLLTKDKHGIDVQLMHNGTMSHFQISGSDSSDTARMVNEVAGPIFERAWKFHDGSEEDLMADESLAAMLKALVGYGVITFISPSGWITKVNQFQGKDYDWGWASNKNELEKKEAWFRKETKDEDRKFLPATSAFVPPDHWKAQREVDENAKLKREADVLTQGEGVKDLIRLSPVSYPAFPKPNTRLTSADFIRPYELSDLVYLDTADIRDLVFDAPEACAVILADLLHELYVKNRTTSVGTAATPVKAETPKDKEEVETH